MRSIVGERYKKLQRGRCLRSQRGGSAYHPVSAGGRFFTGLGNQNPFLVPFPFEYAKGSHGLLHAANNVKYKPGTPCTSGNEEQKIKIYIRAPGTDMQSQLKSYLRGPERKTTYQIGAPCNITTNIYIYILHEAGRRHLLIIALGEFVQYFEAVWTIK